MQDYADFYDSATGFLLIGFNQSNPGVWTSGTLQRPVAAFTFSPSKPAVNTLITFDASSSSDPDGTIVNYAWDFGDGSSTSGSGKQVVTHAYAQRGQRPVTLTVTDNVGLTATSIQQISVLGQPPVASFTFSTPDPFHVYTINFDASASSDPDGTIAGYTWDFGDGSGISSTTNQITHTYAQAGNYPVILTVTDNSQLTARSTQVVNISCSSSDPDFFHNSVSFSNDLTNQIPTHIMAAEFIPFDGCTLEDTAQAFGFDHFNWIQVVTDQPSNNSDPLVCGTPSTPFFDPIPGRTPCVDKWADSLVYYWNEVNEDGTTVNVELNQKKNVPTKDATTLFFEDIPGSRKPFLGPSPEFGFITALVGIQGHVYSVLDTFSWLSTNVIDSDGHLIDGQVQLLKQHVLLQQLPLGIRQFLFSNGAINVFSDANNDGKTDCIDLALIKASYGKRSGQPGFDFRADLNSDGIVNIKDLTLASQRVANGTQCPP